MAAVAAACRAAEPAAEVPTEAPAAEARAEARSEAKAAMERARAEAAAVQDASSCRTPSTQVGDEGSAEGESEDLEADELGLLLQGFARILRRGFGADSVDDADRTAFHATNLPKVSLDFYFERIRSNLSCSTSCFVAASVYIERVTQRERRVAATEWTCHRLTLIAVMLAYRFWEDPDQLDYPAAWFAKLGGIKLAEMGVLESSFLDLLGWRLHIHPDEYSEHLERLRSAAGDCEEEF